MSDMNGWVSTDVPCFAVVGKVNMGKSAVLATLLEEDDDRIIRISPEPGETTRCQRLSLVLDGNERLRFIDTPGFQQPVEALREIRRLHAEMPEAPGREALARFAERHSDNEDFADECQLLAPLLEGAGVLYVVDPSVPVQDSFRAEIEILRLSGRSRLAVLNVRSQGGADAPAVRSDHTESWRDHLGQAFNLVRSFDAHQARYAARRDLLAALNQIDERDREHLETTISLLDAEWVQRRERAAERIQTFIRRALEIREHARYSETDNEPARAKRAAIAQATERYYARLTRLERETGDDLLDIYRHTAIRAEAGDHLAGELDLASDDTWRRLGLTRYQLTWLSAAVGAGAGLGVDAATLGHTLGLGTVFGGLGFGALAFFKGDALPTLALSVGGVSTLGGRQVTLGPPRNANFAWVLLDTVLLRHQYVLSRAHARRGDRGPVLNNNAEAAGLVTRLPGARQKALARWFRAVVRSREDDEQNSEAFGALVATLAEIETQGGPAPASSG